MHSSGGEDGHLYDVPVFPAFDEPCVGVKDAKQGY